MREVILYTAVSLDNFIARPDGSVDWLEYEEFKISGEDYGYRKFYESIDTTLMGNRTYMQLLGFPIEFPYKDKTNYVFTNSANITHNEYVSFISKDIGKFMTDLKFKQGSNIWLIGGSVINSYFLRNNLIDKIIMTIFPIFLGNGIPLFRSLPFETMLEIYDTINYENDVSQLYLKPRKINV